MKKLFVLILMILPLQVEAQSSMNCGFAPFKPLGCQNGYYSCVQMPDGSYQWVLMGC